MRSLLSRREPAPATLGGPPIGTLQVPGRSPAVLALHGFGATPHEVHVVVEIAARLGLRALAPLLPGHGSSVYDLARTRFADWRGAAERALGELYGAAGPVIIVGSSMGALLALDLAADLPERVAGIAVLGAPLRLPWPYPSAALAVMARLGLPDFVVRKTGPDILDPEGRRTQVTYSEQPAHAGNDLRLAGRRIEGRLGLVRCPAFVAHGRHDHVSPVRNARRVYTGLGTVPWRKELLILARSYHIITRDVERALLAARLASFIERLAGGEAAGDEAAAPRQSPVDP